MFRWEQEMNGSRLGSLCLFGLAAIVGLAADLGSKAAIFHWIGFPSEEPLVIVPHWLQFMTRLNQGGIWSIGGRLWRKNEHSSRDIQFGGSHSYYDLGLFRNKGWGAVFPHSPRNDSGGCAWQSPRSNPFMGVRDFIEVHYQDIWYFPTFNVADSCLVCGAACLVLSTLLGVPLPQRHRSQPKPAA